MTRVDIGVFAHNEADGIARMLDGLIRQDTTGLDIKIWVLANGCTDDTADRARAFLRTQECIDSNKSVEVLDLSAPGKSRTWNTYVHEVSRRDAGVLIFSDADIELPERDSLLRLFQGLTSSPNLHGFNSHPIKDIVYRPENLSMTDKVIASGSETLNEWKTAVCGSLYAMPAAKARMLHMPIGLAVEDGFLRAMILTDVMSRDEDLTRLDGGSVFHIFAAERSVSALIRHQTRLVIGTAINVAIFDHLRALPSGRRRAALAEAASQETWLPDVIRSRLPRWPFGWIPFHCVTKRVLFISRQPRNLLQPRRLFMLLVGLGFDLVVYVNAQIKMAKGTGAGYW